MSKLPFIDENEDVSTSSSIQAPEGRPVWEFLSQGIKAGAEQAQNHFIPPELGKIGTDVTSAFWDVPRAFIDFVDYFHEAKRAGDPHPGQTATVQTIVSKLTPGLSETANFALNTAYNTGAFLEKKAEDFEKHHPEFENIRLAAQTQPLASLSEQVDHPADVKALGTALKIPKLVYDTSLKLTGQAISSSGEDLEKWAEEVRNKIPISQSFLHEDTMDGADLLGGAGGVLKNIVGPMFSEGPIPVISNGVNQVIDYTRECLTPSSQAFSTSASPTTPFTPLIPEAVQAIIPHHRFSDSLTASTEISTATKICPEYKTSTASETSKKNTDMSKNLLSESKEYFTQSFSAISSFDPLPEINSNNQGHEFPIDVGVTAGGLALTATVPLSPIILPIAASLGAAYIIGKEALRRIQDNNYGERWSKEQQQVTASFQPIDFPSLVGLPDEIKNAVQAQFQQTEHWRQKAIDAQTEVNMRDESTRRKESRSNLGISFLWDWYTKDQEGIEKNEQDKNRYLAELDQARINQGNHFKQAEQLLNNYVESQERLIQEQEKQRIDFAKNMFSKVPPLTRELEDQVLAMEFPELGHLTEEKNLTKLSDLAPVQRKTEKLILPTDKRQSEVKPEAFKGLHTMGFVCSGSNLRTPLEGQVLAMESRPTLSFRKQSSSLDSLAQTFSSKNRGENYKIPLLQDRGTSLLGRRKRGSEQPETNLETAKYLRTGGLLGTKSKLINGPPISSVLFSSSKELRLD